MRKSDGAASLPPGEAPAIRPVENALPFRPNELNPRFHYFVAFFLRVGLGLSLLNAGLMGYVLSRNGGGMNPFTQSMSVIPGTEPLFDLVPYLQIVVGLALILGFFTTVAAAAAGMLTLLHPLAQTVALLAGGGISARPGMFRFDPSFISLLALGNAPTFLLTAAVLWLSSVRNNPWSLDGLMFAQRRRRLAAREYFQAPAAGQPGARPTGSLAEDAAAAYETRLVREFDAESVALAPGTRATQFAEGRLNATDEGSPGRETTG